MGGSLRWRWRAVRAAWLVALVAALILHPVATEEEEEDEERLGRVYRAKSLLVQHLEERAAASRRLAASAAALHEMARGIHSTAAFFFAAVPWFSSAGE